METDVHGDVVREQLVHEGLLGGYALCNSEEEATTPRSGELCADDPVGPQQVVELIDIRVGGEGTDLLLELPGLIDDAAEHGHVGMRGAQLLLEGGRH